MRSLPTVTINLTAVLVATVVSIVLGGVWYAKPVFGNVWQKLVKLSDTDMKKDRMMAYIGMILASFVTAYVLAHIISYVQANTLWQGGQTGFWVWLGFVAAIMVSGGLFEHRRKKLVAINVFFQLLNLVVIGAILAVWS